MALGRILHPQRSLITKDLVMFIKKAGRCYWGKSTCFCNRCLDHLWLVSAPLRTHRGEGGGFHEEERVSEQEAQWGPAAWTLSRAPQVHCRDSSWPLGLPARRLLLSAWASCAPPSPQAFSGTGHGVLRASRQLEGEATNHPDNPVSQVGPVS